MKAILVCLLLALAAESISAQNSSVDVEVDFELLVELDLSLPSFSQGLSLIGSALCAKAELDKELAEAAVDLASNTLDNIKSSLSSTIASLTSSAESFISSYLCPALISAEESVIGSIQNVINGLKSKIALAKKKAVDAVAAIEASLQNVYNEKVALIGEAYNCLKEALDTAKAAESQLVSQLKQAVATVAQDLHDAFADAIACGEQLLIDSISFSQNVKDQIVQNLDGLYSAFNQFLINKINELHSDIANDITNATDLLHDLESHASEVLANIPSELNDAKSASSAIRAAIRAKLLQTLNDLKAALQPQIDDLNTAISTAVADLAQKLQAEVAALQSLLDLAAQITITVTVTINADGSLGSP